jgi:hypothetical protein
VILCAPYNREHATPGLAITELQVTPRVNGLPPPREVAHNETI